MGVRQWMLGGFGILSLGVGVSLAAQGTRPQDPDVLTALLTEVRGLRAAMEQMASAGPRVQLALGRLQLQEQRVNTMIRRLESLRDSVANAEKEHGGVQGQLSMFEGQLKEQLKNMPAGTTEADHPLGPMVAALRKGLEGTAEHIQRLQAEEAQLQQQVAAEQGRWSEINRALEDLERAMGKR